MASLEQNFKLRIRSRGGVVFEGEVVSLSSINEKGKFDILAKHANFISFIEKELIYVLPDGTENKMKIDSGILRTRDDYVEVYLGVEGIKTQTAPKTTKQ